MLGIVLHVDTMIKNINSYLKTTYTSLGFPDSSVGKESTCSAGDLGSIPGLGRSSGEGESYPLQYSGLENSMDCAVHGVAKSRTQLSDFHFQIALQCCVGFCRTTT